MIIKVDSSKHIGRESIGEQASGKIFNAGFEKKVVLVMKWILFFVMVAMVLGHLLAGFWGSLIPASIGMLTLLCTEIMIRGEARGKDRVFEERESDIKQFVMADRVSYRGFKDIDTNQKDTLIILHLLEHDEDIRRKFIQNDRMKKSVNWAIKSLRLEKMHWEDIWPSDRTFGWTELGYLFSDLGNYSLFCNQIKIIRRPFDRYELF
jgi:hypothetical protein